MNNPAVYNLLNVILLAGTIIYLSILVHKNLGFSAYRFYQFILFISIHIVFLGLYEQGSYSLILFIEKHVDRHIPNFIQALNIFKFNDFPISSFQLIDPIFNILLGSIIASLWRHLIHRNIILTTTHKFLIGLVLIGLAFIFLCFCINNNSMTYVNIIFTYLLFVLAELCFLPTGFSFINNISPSNNKSLFMSFWHMGMGCSQWLALNLAKYTVAPLSTDAHISICYYQQGFLMFSYLALGMISILITIKVIEHYCLKNFNE